MGGSNRLVVLFSAPLVAQGSDGEIHALNFLDFQSERDLLFDSLAEGCHEMGRTIEVRVEAATSDTLRTLVTLGARALHYSGHGHPDFLSFENGRGGIHAMEIETLTKLFAAGGTSTIQLVFVSACYSRRAGEAFAKAGVKHVVAVDIDGRLRDRAALSFTRAFYLALLSGKTVKQSFEIGKAAVESAPDVPLATKEAEKFLLLPLESDHDVHIFADAPAGDGLIDITPAPVANNLPAMPDHFCGRNTELFYLIKAILQDGRLVTVSGAFGRGKSALAVAAGRYLADRRHFQGVFFVRTPRWDGIESMWQAVAQALGRNSRLRHQSKIVKVMNPSLSVNSLSGASENNLVEKANGDSKASIDRRKSSKHFIDKTSIIRDLKHANILLIFDDIETVMDIAPTSFHGFLEDLLTHTLHLKVLLTSSSNSTSKRVTSVTEHVFQLGPLKPIDAAKLLALRAGGEMLKMDLSKLCEKPIMKHLNGNSHAISLAASIFHLQPRSLEEVEKIVLGEVKIADENTELLVKEINLCIESEKSGDGRKMSVDLLRHITGSSVSSGCDKPSDEHHEVTEMEANDNMEEGFEHLLEGNTDVVDHSHVLQALKAEEKISEPIVSPSPPIDLPITSDSVENRAALRYLAIAFIVAWLLHYICDAQLLPPVYNSLLRRVTDLIHAFADGAAMFFLYQYYNSRTNISVIKMSKSPRLPVEEDVSSNDVNNSHQDDLMNRLLQSQNATLLERNRSGSTRITNLRTESIIRSRKVSKKKNGLY